ncbi:HIT domain-containing protein [Fontimonas sp. SYSU GA230001]|uniref:HIT domain-containing protein n=1 Tax=Fontimonas sp. SYSU GA230001 TaxID=3142450 RepID=UPI0032B3AA80
MAAQFELHERLAADTVFVLDWPLSRVLLMNDARYPWVILVPRRSGIREIYELNPADQHTLIRESSAVGQAMMELFGGDKLNVAALGNLVPQLHLHHVVRRQTDPAWPAPVWGRLPPQPYTARALDETLQTLRAHLSPPPGTAHG